jgi:hypothetical protein
MGNHGIPAMDTIAGLGGLEVYCCMASLGNKGWWGWSLNPIFVGYILAYLDMVDMVVLCHFISTMRLVMSICVDLWLLIQRFLTCWCQGDAIGESTWKIPEKTRMFNLVCLRGTPMVPIHVWLGLSWKMWVVFTTGRKICIIYIIIYVYISGCKPL